MNWNSQEKKRLIEAILVLENANEARSFLRDLMTEREIDEFSKRLQVAELLVKGESYVTIEQITGLSSATVARVARWLRRGESGYQTVISKLHHDQSVIERGFS